MNTITLFVGDENGLRDYRKPKSEHKPKSKFDPKFAAQTRLRRRALEVTQADFAELLGVHQVTFCNLERGKTPFTPSMIVRISNALDDLES